MLAQGFWKTPDTHATTPSMKSGHRSKLKLTYLLVLSESRKYLIYKTAGLGPSHNVFEYSTCKSSTCT